MKTQTLKIQNLKCGGCAHTITTKISEIESITNVKVDIENESITFNYLESNDIENVKEKLVKIGYPIEGDENTLSSKAKSFVSCAVGRINS